MARDRYLWNAGEETIHRENRQPPPSKKSKWENFWYYHKVHVAIILIVALLAGEFIREMVLKREPDYEVALLTQSGYSDRFLTALESELEKYGTDLNKDGRVLVQVNSYVIVTQKGVQVQDPNVQIASVARFSVDLQNGHSMIYLTDDANFREIRKQGEAFTYVDGSLPAKNAKDDGNMRVPWEKCKLLADFRPKPGEEANAAEETRAVQSLKGLSISMRAIEGTPLAEKEGIREYYTASRRLFEKLVYGR